MGGSESLAWTSLTLAVAVATIAVLLGLRVWWERRTRHGGLSALDRRYFRLQDLRRGVGVGLMVFLACGVYVGARLPIFVVEPGMRGPADPGTGAVVLAARETLPNHFFLALWLGVFVSVLLLLGLAIVDWRSTRQYARRQRREMDLQRAEILRETIQQAVSDGLDPSDGRTRDPA